MCAHRRVCYSPVHGLLGRDVARFVCLLRVLTSFAGPTLLRCSFFKLFPLVNQHSEGLDKFGRFAAAELAKQAESRLKRRVAGAGEKVAYVDLVARLVEAVATAIKEVQAVVNEHYGPGHVLRVLKQLQDQCDAQAAQLLDQFASERELESRIHADLADTNPAEFDTLLGELAEIMKRCALYLNLFLHKLVTVRMCVRVLRGWSGASCRADLARGHLVANGHWSNVRVHVFARRARSGLSRSSRRRRKQGSRCGWSCQTRPR